MLGPGAASLLRCPAGRPLPAPLLQHSNARQGRLHCWCIACLTHCAQPQHLPMVLLVLGMQNGAAVQSPQHSDQHVDVQVGHRFASQGADPHNLFQHLDGGSTRSGCGGMTTGRCVSGRDGRPGPGYKPPSSSLLRPRSSGSSATMSTSASLASAPLRVQVDAQRRLRGASRMQHRRCSHVELPKLARLPLPHR
jgi:hypothetical protein